MKKYILTFSLLIFGAFSLLAEEYRVFKSADGKEIKGRVMAYDGSSEAVTIQRDNKKTCKVPINVFCDEDQTYILKWKNLEGLRSESKFKISCEKRRVKTWSEKQMGGYSVNGTDAGTTQIGKTDFEEVAYEIRLTNRNNSPVQNLVLEYCIYYEQQESKGRGAQLGVFYGVLPIEQINANGNKVIETPSVCVFEYEMGTEFVDSYSLEGEVFGMVMRLYFMEGERKILVREISRPENISATYAWETESRPVGNNE